ncbi:MAG: hypothetical protein ACK5BL_02570 [Flavobacteriales bacterium]|jgi:hypothetical protein
MKTIQLIIAISMMTLKAVAQNQSGTEKTNVDQSCETTFITLGTGLNSNYGLAGLGVDFKLMDKVQGSVSGGLGSWGFKSAAELRYFYSGCMQKGSAIAAGIAYASGLPEMETELELSNEESKNVTLELGAQTNLQLSWYKSYAIKEHHRFFFQVGYSFPITGINYKVTSGETLSDLSKTTMKMMAPGGVLVATGFGFGF